MQTAGEWKMTISQLIIAEHKARREGNLKLADALQVQRWQQAMGTVACSENSKAVVS
jgi:hypothetical protein